LLQPLNKTGPESISLGSAKIGYATFTLQLLSNWVSLIADAVNSQMTAALEPRHP
jgi:hypothetical protein